MHFLLPQITNYSAFFLAANAAFFTGAYLLKQSILSAYKKEESMLS
jgi:hypothetical protein